MTKKSNYSNQILLDYHIHNLDLYNQLQLIFFFILAIIIFFILSAYFTILEKTFDPLNVSIYDPKYLCIATIIASLIMSFLNYILINHGWNLRKIQWIIIDIYKCTSFQQKNNFLQNYNNENKLTLPNFYAICLIFSDIIKVATTIGITILCNKPDYGWGTVTSFITMISIVIDILVYQYLIPKD